MQYFNQHDSVTGYNYMTMGKYRIYEPNYYLPKLPVNRPFHDTISDELEAFQDEQSALCDIDIAPFLNVPQEPIFEEFLVVDNIACTVKLKEIGIMGNKYKQKNTKNKEVYLLDFKGTWAQFKALISHITQLGVSWKRNVGKYTQTQTHFLALDFDDLTPYGAEALLKTKNEKNILIVESARCNYVPAKEGEEIDLSKEWLCKYHVFQYEPNGFNLDKSNLDALTRQFCDKYRELSGNKDEFEFDPALVSNSWTYIYSKAPVPEQSQTPTNERYKSEKGIIFDYVKFTSLFENHPYAKLAKCSDYVPNATHDKYDGKSYDAEEEYAKQITQSKELIKVFNVNALATLQYEQQNPLAIKKLLDLAGIPEGSKAAPFPHFNIGRPRYVKEGERNAKATLICHLIAFNIYSFKKSFNISVSISKEDVIKAFNCAFNSSNVQDYEDFMRDFDIVRAVERFTNLDHEYNEVIKTHNHPTIKCTKVHMTARFTRKSLDRNLMVLKEHLSSNGVIDVPTTKTDMKALKNAYLGGNLDKTKICKEYHIKDEEFEKLIELKFTEYGIPLPPKTTSPIASYNPFGLLTPVCNMGLGVKSSLATPSYDGRYHNKFAHLFIKDFISKCEQAELHRSDASQTHSYPVKRAVRSDKGQKHHVTKANPRKGKTKYDFLRDYSDEERKEWFKQHKDTLSKQNLYNIKTRIYGKQEL